MYVHFCFTGWGLLPSAGFLPEQSRGWSYEAFLIIKGERFGTKLLAFSLPRGEGSLTYGFQAWREAKGLDFTYDLRSVGNHSLLFSWCC